MPLSPTLICRDCEAETARRSNNQTRCRACYLKAQAASRQRWKQRNAPEKKVIQARNCCDCGVSFLPQHDSAKRCPSCREEQHKEYFQRRSVIARIRGNYASLAVLDPAAAREFDEAMRAEEGDEFVEFVLDGMVEKARAGTLVPTPKDVRVYPKKRGPKAKAGGSPA